MLLAAILALGLVAACTEDDEGPTGIIDAATERTESSGIDREAVLGELSEVRDLFAARSPLPPELLDDVSYQDGSLRVTLAQEAEGAEQASQVCNDLSQSIQLPDLAISVVGPDGTELASCTFGR